MISNYIFLYWCRWLSCTSLGEILSEQPTYSCTMCLTNVSSLELIWSLSSLVLINNCLKSIWSSFVFTIVEQVRDNCCINNMRLQRWDSTMQCCQMFLSCYTSMSTVYIEIENTVIFKYSFKLELLIPTRFKHFVCAFSDIITYSFQQ